MKQGRKILFCDNVLWGLVNFRGSVIRHFVQQGDEVVLVAPQDDESIMKVDIPEGVRYIPVRLNRCSRNPFTDLIYCAHLYRIYRKEHPDYIFHYTIKPNVYGSIAARLAGINCTGMVAGLGYGLLGDGMLSRLLAVMYRYAFKYVSSIFVLNKFNYQYLLDHKFCTSAQLRLFKGGEGVDLSAYPYVREESGSPVVFLMVGRVLYDKGYREYVQAAKIVKQQYPDVRCQLLGMLDETYPAHVDEEELKRDVEEGTIEYLASTNDVMQYLGRSGVVVVLPSYFEGLSRSLMEACAVGRPIIATDIPGCRETVDEGKNGFLVKVKDSSSLAEGMLRYLSLSDAEKQAFSRHSRKKAEETFDVRQVIKEYEKDLAKARK
jgi:glycosyltransferase involved in cell wall biosynthesis